MPKKQSPNFLTNPVPGIEDMLESERTVKEPAPHNIPMEGGRTGHVQHSHGHYELHNTPEGSVTQIPKPRQPKPPKKERPPRRFKLTRWIVLIVVVAIIAATAPAVYALIRAGWAAQSAKILLERAVSEVQDGDAEGAVATLGDAKDQLGDARDALKGTGFWRDAPGVGTQVRALEDAASAGASTVDGVRDIFQVISGLLDAASSVSVATGELVNPVEAHRSFNDLTPEEKRSMLAKLDRSLPDIREAQAKVAVALSTWNRIPQNQLYAPIRKAFQPVADNLPRLKKTLDEAVPLLEAFIPLAGYPEPADYLVVLQNSDEIRATGGFLGTVGTLKVDGGDLKQFAFSDVYSLDNPASGNWNEVPPAPIRDRLGVPKWFFRDSNWSPDFPTSAQKMSDFYVHELKAGLHVDVPPPSGVIAMNAPFFEELLRITGPITVDGVTFNAENFFETLEYEVEQAFLNKGISVDQRKQILVKLGDALIDKVMSLPARQWPELLDLTTDALDHKQIQIYARDPELLKRLDAFEWTGRAKPTNGDFLWVIDSNLAALKTDGIMDKGITYKVDATNPARVVATVTLKYTNNGPGIGKDYRYTRYRDYVRLYVPDGSTLVDVKGAMKDDRYRTGGRFVAGPVDVYKELGKTVFGAFWSIEPKNTQEITFTYVLPAEVGERITGKGVYHLDIPAQSGNEKTDLTLDLRFGKNLKSAVPGEESEQHGDANYRVESITSEDRSFEVTF
jgi:hypothetical protein